jgi:hexosaminidase
MQTAALVLAVQVLIVQGQLPASDDVPRLWPQPASITAGKENLVLTKGGFNIVAKGSTVSDILEWNMAYYATEIFARAASPDAPDVPPRPAPPTLPLAQLEIVVKKDEPGPPSLGMDESYTLTLGSPTATLNAPAVWGAVRGLETFSQLLQMNGEYTIQGGSGLAIKDFPRFPWRGIMIDPARHFLTVAEVNKTIDGMSQNKLNALHLHLTDGESFTVNTEGWTKFPLLSTKGAYAPQLSYSKNDLAAIVAHGRLRGIRVIPEFDLPAHMASWAQGYDELITDCPTVNPYPQWPRYYSPADVTNPTLYEVIDEILTELGPVFPDPFWHVGGDEPHFDCWAANANVTKYMKDYHLDNEGLYAMFETRYAGLLANHSKRVVGWAEIFSVAGTAPDKNTTVIEVWQGNKELADVVQAGYSGIVSSNWYLNNGGDWTKYYTDDPLAYLPKTATPAEKARVLGGESCMWNSAFDANSNMEPAMWPNAAAVAEQLWSPKVEDVDTARTRLSQHRCRMVRRGVRASPIAEDYCGQDLYIRKSRSFAYPGDFPVSPETPRP